jgi:hypothetical protein
MQNNRPPEYKKRPAVCYSEARQAIDHAYTIGITIADIARYCGYTYAYINMMYNGHRRMPKTIYRRIEQLLSNEVKA